MRSVVVAAIALASLVGFTLPGANGGYIAKIANGNDTATTRPYFTCTNAAQGPGAANTYFAYPFGDANGTLGATDISGNVGRAGAYTTAGVIYGVANGGVCPRDSKTVITLNGSTGYVSGPVGFIAAPNTFTVEIWFKTTVKQGKLIGFGNARTGASSSFDRHIYITPAGNLVFGIYQTTPAPATVKTVATNLGTANGVADGNWHQAVGTMSPTTGITLYLDGTLIGTDSTATSAEPYTAGYWRIGYDNLNTGWPNSGTNYFFSGQLAFASAYSVALTAAQVAAHYRAGTA